MSDERYVVITEDGLQMWAPMDRDVAEKLAEKPTASGHRQIAVPERVATVISLAWRELGEESRRRLEQDRIAATNRLLSAYDDTKHLAE